MIKTLKKVTSRNIAIASLCVVSLVSLALLITFALFNRPIADDVSYFRYFESGSAGSFLYWHYFEHTGRLLQSFLITIGYVISGAFSVKIMPLLVYLSLIVASSWTIYRFTSLKNKPILLSILLGLSISSAVILLMPSVYDSYLWWTSSSIYLASIVTLLLTICIFDVLRREKPSKAVQALLLFVIAIGQTLSEITSAVAICLAFIALVYYLWKKQKPNIVAILKVLLALIVGFFITYFSPGSIARRQSEDGGAIGFDFMRIFVLSTKHTFELISSVSLWEVALLVLIGISLGVLLKKVSRKNMRTTNFITLIFAFVAIYGSFCINNYVWYNMPLRALTLPSFALTISAITLVALLTNYVFYKFNKRSVFLVLYLLLAAVLLSSSLYGVLKYGIPTASFMYQREEAYTAREDSIEKQLDSSDIRVIYIESLPIIVNSQATDLVYGGGEQVDWYETAFRAHNNIPASIELEVIAPPYEYCIFGKTPTQKCTERGDNTTLRKVVNKANNFMLYYFTLSY